jgi:hypothetical protein
MSRVDGVVHMRSTHHTNMAPTAQNPAGDRYPDEQELDATRFPLHAAAVSGHFDEVSSLLHRQKCNPNALCPNGRSALVYAVHGGSKSCIDALLASGADINLADATGVTAIQWAASQADHSMVKCVCLRSASPSYEGFMNAPTLPTGPSVFALVHRMYDARTNVHTC